MGGAGERRRSGRVIQRPIKVTVNGKERELPGELAVPALLDELGIDRRIVAVAVNSEVVSRDRYEETALHDGDSVEVVRMVGGG